MDKVSVSLTVIFDDPFWVGIFEAVSDRKLSACRVVFGEEPKDYETYGYVLGNYFRLRFSPPVTAAEDIAKRNPKRMQREIRRQMENAGIGTKSQQALQLQREQLKSERKTLSREMKENEKRKRFELRQRKKREKHKGR